MILPSFVVMCETSFDGYKSEAHSPQKHTQRQKYAWFMMVLRAYN